MKIRPLHNQVLIKRESSEKKTASGLYIPDSAQEKSHRGEVIAVGQGKRLDNGELRPCLVKAGEKVLFEVYGGSEVKIDGVEYLIAKDTDILGVFVEA
jgi:chaperonin GroES